MNDSPTSSHPPTAPLITTPAAPAAPVTPVSGAERIATLDVLRGFAILGILFVNMEIFRAPVYNFYLPPVPDANVFDAAARWFIFSFAATKFYTIFSLLFGIGMSIQLERVRQRGGTFTWRYLRRLLALLLIGLVHSLFIWLGDILVSYALLGVLLLILRGLPRIVLLIFAMLAYLAPLGLFALGGIWAVSVASLTPEGADMMASNTEAAHEKYNLLREQALVRYGTGGFWDAFDQRLVDHTQGSLWMIGAMWPGIIAMFLLGRVVWLRGILQHPDQHMGLLRALSTWGLGLGIVLGAGYGWLTLQYGTAELSFALLAALALQALSTPLLSFGYVAVLVRLMQSTPWQQGLSPLAAVGRMALTNYILQSVVCTTIFYGYGFGWFGHVGPAAGLVLTLVIFACQIPLSMLWLRHFRFGPLEWLWRTLTYARWQPMRKAAAR